MTLALTVAEQSQVEPVQRAVAAQAERVGFDDAGVASVAAVAGRLANRLVETSTQGLLLVTSLARGGVAGLELIALGDSGGHADTLAAISPLVAIGDSYSAPGETSGLVARLWVRPPPACDLQPACDVGAVNVPAPGEWLCGDGWWAENTSARALIVLADGLGHGPVAHDAAQKAITVARAHHDRRPHDLMVHIHEGLRQSRGAAVLVVEIDLARQSLTCCGVGNIAGMIVTPTGASGLVSQYGTAGLNKIRLKEFTYPFPAEALLVLHSDGLKTTWKLDRYPGLAQHEPRLVAAVLYRDFVRGRDDTTVVVLKGRQGLARQGRGDA